MYVSMRCPYLTLAKISLVTELFIGRKEGGKPFQLYRKQLFNQFFDT